MPFESHQCTQQWLVDDSSMYIPGTIKPRDACYRPRFANGSQSINTGFSEKNSGRNSVKSTIQVMILAISWPIRVQSCHDFPGPRAPTLPSTSFGATVASMSPLKPNGYVNTLGASHFCEHMGIIIPHFFAAGFLSAVVTIN